VSNSGDDDWSNKATAGFLRKSSNDHFLWGMADLAPEVERHAGGEVSRKIYGVCKTVLGESSTASLHLLVVRRFQQHRNRKCLCKFGLIYFPFKAMGGRQILIHR